MIPNRGPFVCDMVAGPSLFVRHGRRAVVRSGTIASGTLFRSRYGTWFRFASLPRGTARVPDSHAASPPVRSADEETGRASQRKRADARRNEQSLLDAAARMFVTSGV